MKTITSGDEIAALLETLPEGAIMRTSDGVANQFHKYGDGQYQEDLAGRRSWTRTGRGYWTRTDATYLDEIIPDRLLPATLIHPVIFDAEDVERAARALAEARYEGCPLEDLADIHLAEMLDQARAVLGAVGEVEA